MCTHSEMAEPTFGKWVTGALANGSLKCKPDAHVVGSGLENIQEGLDKLGKPVSARKYVVELP